MKKLSTALAIATVLSIALPVVASAFIRPVPVHFVSVAELPSEITLDVSEMLCLTRPDNVGPFVGLSVEPIDPGPLLWTSEKDERGTIKTVACFHTVTYGEADIHVLTTKKVNGVYEQIDATLRIKVIQGAP